MTIETPRTHATFNKQMQRNKKELNLTSARSSQKWARSATAKTEQIYTHRHTERERHTHNRHTQTERERDITGTTNKRKQILMSVHLIHHSSFMKENALTLNSTKASIICSTGRMAPNWKKEQAMWIRLELISDTVIYRTVRIGSSQFS